MAVEALYRGKHRRLFGVSTPWIGTPVHSQVYSSTPWISTEVRQRVYWSTAAGVLEYTDACTVARCVLLINNQQPNESRWKKCRRYCITH